MARSKTFSPEQAVDRAMEVFWRRGYEGTSINHLIDHMEISRQSLYDTYGDKKALFLLTLKRYSEFTDWFLSKLNGPDSSFATIEQHFEIYLADVVANGDRRVCMLAAIGNEFRSGFPDPRIEEGLRECQRKVQDAYTNAIRNGQARGEIRRDLNPEVSALQLACFQHGVGVMAEGGIPMEELRACVKAKLAELTGVQPVATQYQS